MSYQRDYLLRMIEMIGDLIAGILGLIRKGEFKKASESIDQVYYDMLKEDASFFRKIPLEKLTFELIENHNYTNDHLLILSELFFADAELNKAQGKNDEALLCYQKSFALLEFTTKESASFSINNQTKLAKIENEIGQLKS